MKKIVLSLLCFSLVSTSVFSAVMQSDKNIVYFTNGRSMGSLDISSNIFNGYVKASMSDWAPAYPIKITADNKFAYVGNLSDWPVIHNVGVVDIKGNKTIGIVEGLPSDAAATAIAIAPNGKYGYIAIRYPNLQNETPEAIYIFNTSDNKVIGSIKAYEGKPRQMITNKIAFTPDGKKAIILLDPMLRRSNVLIVDTTTHTVISRLNDAQHQFEDVVISPDGKKAYFASSFGKKEIMVMDMEKNAEIKFVAIHDDFYHYPYQMAMTPNGNKIYILDTGQTISVFDARSDTYVRNIILKNPPTYIYKIAVSTAGNKMYLMRNDASISIIDASTDEEIGLVINNALASMEDAAVFQAQQD